MVRRSPVTVRSEDEIMSVVSSVFPLNEQLVGWMGEHNLTPPAGWKPGQLAAAMSSKRWRIHQLAVNVLDGVGELYRFRPAGAHKDI